MPEFKTDRGLVSVDLLPNLCPICHYAVSPHFVSATSNSDTRNIDSEVNAAFKCTAPNCYRLFIATYKKKQLSAGSTSGSFFLIDTAPKTYKASPHEAEITSNFPSFIKIFSQAEAAEANGLDEIAGVGYRKALEFLIKDYCIHKMPEKSESIKITNLGSVIDNFVEDTNLKNCSKRATWLGNDETHYTKKWDDRDINDLKILIKLSCSWINSNLLTEKYLQEMQ